MNRRLLVLALTVVIFGCGTDVEPTQPRQERATTDLGAVGYEHPLAKSRFAIGNDAHTEVNSLGMQRDVGSEGVFAFHLTTKGSKAVPNATSSAKQAPSFTGTGDEHAAAVKAYFVGAGLPVDQVARTDSQTVMSGGGTVGSGEESASVTAYVTSLIREVAGVSVPDSIAWARLNANQAAVEESVFWPALSSSVIADAQALVQIASDPAQLAAYRAKLPQGSGEGEVMIRHSAWSTVPFFASASYDVTVLPPQGGGYQRHFDVNGKEFRLPEEM